MICWALVLAADMLAGLAARVKKVRTKFVVAVDKGLRNRVLREAMKSGVVGDVVVVGVGVWKVEVNVR